ncbi:Hypothetical protein D9617_20g027930 [Elsinoe fawcettii]|nr:Hypothetical protein D9617_20g027930 [Elsinoe fawcettii]
MLNHLVPNRSQLAPSFNDHPPARIGVFGEGIGGGLASMLALTECHSKGHGITTSAVHEPLLNWVLPEESALEKQIEDTSVSKRKKSSSNLSKPLDADMLRSLISTRSECFKGPGDWFDPFASPLLFFRSSNAPIPLTDPNAPVDEFSELSALNQQNFFKQQRILSALNSAPGLIDTPIRRIEDEDNGSVLKKSARRYPRVDSDLTLPTFRLSTGPTRFWQAQVEEFSRYLRRSMIRTDELKKRDMASAELHAEERVVHDVYAGHHDRDERLSDTAEWFRNVL